MKPEGSLPCSQERSTGPYPEPADSIHILTLCLFKIHMMHVLVLKSPKCFHPFRCPD